MAWNFSLGYKKRLYNIAVKILEDRIKVSHLAIANAQASANEEEKSSAGDKYETSRAMSHLEKDMYAKQLASNKNELAALLAIDCTKLYHSILPGTIINCGECKFFIAAGLGKIIFDEEIVYLISPKAPLSNLFYNKKIRDTILFNGKELVINEIY